MIQRQTWRHFDFLLFGAVIILCMFGVAMIRSAAAGNEEILQSVPRQIIFIVVSMIVILITAAIDYHYCQPEVNESTTIEIKGGRHPVIERQLKQDEEYISNDVMLDEDVLLYRVSALLEGRN